MTKNTISVRRRSDRDLWVNVFEQAQQSVQVAEKLFATDGAEGAAAEKAAAPSASRRRDFLRHFRLKRSCEKSGYITEIETLDRRRTCGQKRASDTSQETRPSQPTLSLRHKPDCSTRHFITTISYLALCPSVDHRKQKKLELHSSTSTLTTSVHIAILFAIVLPDSTLFVHIFGQFRIALIVCTDVQGAVHHRR